VRAGLSSRDSEPQDDKIPRGSSLSEISRHLGLRASPAKLPEAPDSPRAPPPTGTPRRPPGARVDLAVLSAAARPGDLDTPDHPKLLSPLAGQPVLAHVMRQLRRGGIRRVVVVLGNRGAQVRGRVLRGRRVAPSRMAPDQSGCSLAPAPRHPRLVRIPEGGSASRSHSRPARPAVLATSHPIAPRTLSRTFPPLPRCYLARTSPSWVRPR
jgi:hypothetical protein